MIETDCVKKIDGMLRQLEALRIAFDMKGANATTILRVVNTLSTMKNTLSAALVAPPAVPGEVERMQDKIEGLEADLENAVEVAFKRGATEWTRLNYPDRYAVLSSPPSTAVAGGEPVLYVSAAQLPMLPEHGYFPARSKPEGKFQTPLYLRPSSPAPEPAVTDNRHEFVPNKRYPWFCAHCGYAPHEPLKHVQPAAPASEGSNNG